MRRTFAEKCIHLADSDCSIASQPSQEVTSTGHPPSSPIGMQPRSPKADGGSADESDRGSERSSTMGGRFLAGRTREAIRVPRHERNDGSLSCAMTNGRALLRTGPRACRRLRRRLAAKIRRAGLRAARAPMHWWRCGSRKFRLGRARQLRRGCTGRPAGTGPCAGKPPQLALLGGGRGAGGTSGARA